MLVRFLVHGNSVSYFTVDALSLAAAIAAALHLSYRAVICCAACARCRQSPDRICEIASRNGSSCAICLRLLCLRMFELHAKKVRAKGLPQ